MANEPLTPAAEGVPEESFINRMVRLFAELHTIGDRVGEMPDRAMNHITEAQWIVSKAIIDAPVICEADVAGKLRHAILMIECPHGIYNDEVPAVAGALEALVKFRRDEFERDWRACAK